MFSNRPPKEEKSARENSSVVDQYDELFGCGPEDPAPDAKRIRPSEDLKNLDSKFPLNPVVISNKENSGDFKNKTLNGKGSELADELNSDLDDEEADAEEVDDEVVGDLVLCQYEKIHRVRSRWRGVLRSGIIHVADSDLCFNRSTIDLEW